MDGNELKDTIRAIMDDELAARGWSKRQAQKVFKYYDGEGPYDYWTDMNSCQIFVLWSDNHTSRHASDNKATATWEGYVAAVCKALEQQCPETAPMKIDPRKVKPLWQKPLKMVLDVLMQHAAINTALKP